MIPAIYCCNDYTAARPRRIVWRESVVDGRMLGGTLCRDVWRVKLFPGSPKGPAAPARLLRECSGSQESQNGGGLYEYPEWAGFV